jgi:hypothetical protein
MKIFGKQCPPRMHKKESYKKEIESNIRGGAKVSYDPFFSEGEAGT